MQLVLSLVPSARSVEGWTLALDDEERGLAPFALNVQLGDPYVGSS
jgi:hypothetical protein